MPKTYTLEDNQCERIKQWMKYHWEVQHPNFRPRDCSGVAVKISFIPGGTGDTVTVECIWCKEGHPGHEIDLTIDNDGDGTLIYEYDETWTDRWYSWEKK